MRSPLNKTSVPGASWRIWKISGHFYLDDADDRNGIRISGGRWKYDPGVRGSFEKYNIENGHFRTEKKMNNAQEFQDIERIWASKLL